MNNCILFSLCNFILYSYLLLGVPWVARRSNQSIPKEINPNIHSLEGLMLKLQYFGHLMLRADSLEKTLTLEKTDGKRWRGKQMMRCLDSITDSIDMNISKLWERLEDRGAWHAITTKNYWIIIYYLNSAETLVGALQLSNGATKDG